MEFLLPGYTWFKALHIIGFVTWFAGLFYMVRLFVYHAEAEEEEEPKKSILQAQFHLMEWRLFYIITWPGMVITLVMGTLMFLAGYQVFLIAGWMHVKLLFVVGCIFFHFWCGQKIKALKEGRSKTSGQVFRILNEVATILLVGIVFLAVFKNTVNFIYGLVGLFALGISLMAGIKIYKSIRASKKA